MDGFDTLKLRKVPVNLCLSVDILYIVQPYFIIIMGFILILSILSILFSLLLISYFYYYIWVLLSVLCYIIYEFLSLFLKF